MRRFKALPSKCGDEESFLMPELVADGVTFRRAKDNDDTAAWKLL